MKEDSSSERANSERARSVGLLNEREEFVKKLDNLTKPPAADISPAMWDDIHDVRDRIAKIEAEIRKIQSEVGGVFDPNHIPDWAAEPKEEIIKLRG